MDKRIGIAFMCLGALFPLSYLYGHLTGHEAVSETFSFVGIGVMILGALTYPNSGTAGALGRLADVLQKFAPWIKQKEPPAPPGA